MGLYQIERSIRQTSQEHPLTGKRYSRARALDVVSGVMVLRTGAVEVVGLTGATEEDVAARTCELVEGLATTGEVEVT